MNKQQLASKIWESANQMRSKIEANEYKDYILGFIFYKFLSDTEVRFLEENDFSEEDIKAVSAEDEETMEYIRQNIGYFIAYNDLFSTWLEKGSKFDVSDVTDALSAFSRHINGTHKKVFENIFRTLETGLSKLGDTSGARTKAISGLLQLIKDIPMDEKQDYDVLGFIYEYLIEKFAANAGKKAGEFYTPHEVSLLMSEIVANHLKDRKEIKIYDPTSGSGSLLINIGKSVGKYMSDSNNIKYYAQELKENTYNLTRMNLVMRGIKPDNIVTRNGDTLEDDWPYFEENDPQGTYEPLYVDGVVSNPPYSQKWDPANKEHDPRFAHFGVAPKGKADYAFLLHDLYHVKPDGIMTIVLPHGVLFRGGEEGEIRKNLIEYNNIDAIIGLPANIFFGTGIPTIIMVLKHEKDNTDVLIIDASKGFEKEGKNNKLRACDIKKIADTVAKRETIPGYSKVASRDEIRANDYNLNIPRYVDSSEAPETWDIYASMFGGIPYSEIEELSEYWDAFPGLKEDLFTKDSEAYASLAVSDVKAAIKNHEDVERFRTNFTAKFSGFREFLDRELLEDVESVEGAKEENLISEEIFSRLEEIPLVDKYEAYQLLDDEWKEIAVDLEIIQTEGFDATKAVDPEMTMKKQGGKDVEVQTGWMGRIIPFDLIQKTVLKDEAVALKAKENRLSEISSDIEEILDSLSEEEKETEVVNDNGDALVAKEIPKKIKELKHEDETEDTREFIEKLETADALFKEEKRLKSEIKSESSALVNHTKETIENLSNEEARTLLEMKWIDSLLENLRKLPENIIDNLTKAVQQLSKKYETTFFDIEREIEETERELSDMTDELTGDEFDMKGLSSRDLQMIGNSVSWEKC